MPHPIDAMPFPVGIVMPAGEEIEPPRQPRNELDDPRPTCLDCSASWAQEHGVPARVRVARCVIIRDTVIGGFVLVASCHEAKPLSLRLPDDVDERRIAAIGIAFQKGRVWDGNRK